MEYKNAKFEDLLGKYLTKLEVAADNSKITFTCSDGSMYEMSHCQDCCESVEVEDICGNTDHLIGYPIIFAEVSTDREHPREESWNESFTWTFYKLATIKGFCVIRWYGQSNGYYSEEVDMYLIQEPTSDGQMFQSIPIDNRTEEIQAVLKEIESYINRTLAIPQELIDRHNQLVKKEEYKN